ncbi:MAG: ACP S-malonyltransferase [Bdellovibrionales bacterium]|nr:ACP S-malonyltransferase [Bdellovibrionales bacterium]
MITALFPGQGSQYVGMGKFLYDNFKSTKLLFEEASDHLKLDFKKLCFDGPDEDLQLTENTQPAIVLVSVATYYSVSDNFDVQPHFFAGHSVGEYSACVAANSLDFKDAIKAVKIRGKAMQEAVPVCVGGMTAVMGLSLEQATLLCDWVKKNTDKIVEPANDNCPGQIVLSGHKKALDWMAENFKVENLFTHNPPKRVKFIPLKVSAPFHCSLMNPAQEKMKITLSSMNFKSPQSALLQNVKAQTVNDSSEIQKNLVEQVSGVVRWTQTINEAHSQGSKYFIEFGDSKVLSGLNKKINSELKTFNLQSLEDIKNLEQNLREVL